MREALLWLSLNAIGAARLGIEGMILPLRLPSVLQGGLAKMVPLELLGPFLLLSFSSLALSHHLAFGLLLGAFDPPSFFVIWTRDPTVWQEAKAGKEPLSNHQFI